MSLVQKLSLTYDEVKEVQEKYRVECGGVESSVSINAACRRIVLNSLTSFKVSNSPPWMNVDAWTRFAIEFGGSLQHLEIMEIPVESKQNLSFMEFGKVLPFFN
jgi:hypothetical protein